jgi:hypothetical protein
VLGVDPEAGIDDIRARYRALARDLHPDRRRDVSDVGDGVAMAAVNRAWAVLSDPLQRAEYDEQITALTSTRPTPSHPPEIYQPSPAGCLASASGALPWLALLVVLAAIFVFTAYAGSGDDEPVDPDTDAVMVPVRDLRGSCVRLVGGATVTVDCLTVPHEGVIVAQASVGARCPEGTVEWLIRQQNVLACTEPGSQVRGP